MGLLLAAQCFQSRGLSISNDVSLSQSPQRNALNLEIPACVREFSEVSQQHLFSELAQQSDLSICEGVYLSRSSQSYAYNQEIPAFVRESMVLAVQSFQSRCNRSLVKYNGCVIEIHRPYPFKKK